ncbi:Myb-like protein L [Hordeum vulgare]|nr:Myb-like protein L [Hordeum vulgare]
MPNCQTNEYKGERIKGASLIPERKRVGRLSDDEDKRLLASVKIFRSGNWNKIAQFVPSRNQSQCSERCCNVLDSDIDHGNGVLKRIPSYWLPSMRLVPAGLRLLGL